MFLVVQEMEFQSLVWTNSTSLKAIKAMHHNYYACTTTIGTYVPRACALQQEKSRQ